MPEPTCARCFRVLSADDIVESVGEGVGHVDCRRPRDLTHQERSLLYAFCWSHPIACPTCAQGFRLFELDSDPFDYPKRTCCPHCRADLIESVRDHLYTCPQSPEVLRRKARDARENARRLVKQAQALRDRADVLMREAEVVAAELRETMRQSAEEGLRRLIQRQLRDGALPHDTAQAVPGYPGDGSICGACGQSVGRHELMMVLPHATISIPLHADCFEIWNEERRAFRGGT